MRGIFLFLNAIKKVIMILHKKTITTFALVFIMQFLFLAANAQLIKNNNWNFNLGWKNKTVYSKTYIVNQRHAKASDANPGTEALPLLTINKAAQLVKAGERVLIYTGVYREMIQPLYGGLAADKMIAYEAAPGEKVIVKGSKIIEANWQQRMVYTDKLPDSTKTYTWSRKTWVTTLPDDFFEDNYFPLRLLNIEPAEYDMMNWAGLVKKITPYNSSRALLFQNGKRMLQVAAYGDVAKMPGSFWVDNDKKSLHIHSFDSKNPNGTLFELGVKHHLFLPQDVGLNYIQLSGITFEQCANGFLRTSTGAVTALGGHHWIIENNTIRQINSSGLEFGYLAFEREDPTALNIKTPRKKPDAVGSPIVRNNTIYECGTAGIRCYVVEDGLVENNHIYNCGWQDAENYWEVAGIKMLEVHNSLVRGNYIHNITGGNGIWLDWNNYGSRVTQNIIHDVQTIQGGIFIEASHHPNLVDNNFIWNIDGNGIYANDNDSLMVYHNLIANFTGNAIHAVVATNRSQNGRKLTAQHSRIANNIFINGQPSKYSDTANLSDYNLYVSTNQPDYFTPEALKLSGEGTNSKHIYASANFINDNLFFQWQSAGDIMAVPAVPFISTDFFGGLRNGKTTTPGPFALLPKTASFLLNEK
jgi:alpha-L-arabinofuranosidase